MVLDFDVRLEPAGRRFSIDRRPWHVCQVRILRLACYRSLLPIEATHEAVAGHIVVHSISLRYVAIQQGQNVAG